MLPAPAATRTFPTLSLRILPWMPEPIPRRVAECVCLVLPQPSSAFPIIRLGRLPARFREHDFSRVGFRGCSYFVMFKPPSLLASQIVPTAASVPCWAAEACTSEQNVRRCLRTHRTCYPPDYRQLAERGLSPRKIRSLVGCSRMMPTSPSSPLKFRTAGFPQYGFKAGISSSAFPRGVHVSRRLVCIHPSCSPLANAQSPFCAGGVARTSTAMRAASTALPQGPSLRAGLCCLGPSSLIRPHPSHSQAHPDFTAERLIRDVFAVRSR